MGLFKGIHDTYRKSEAAVVVENLLSEQQEMMMFDADPGGTANSIITAAWNAKGDALSGRFGKRPHKISVAAFSLAYALAKQQVFSEENQHGLALAYLRLLTTLQTNGRLIPFERVDDQLIEWSIQIGMASMANSSNPALQQVGAELQEMNPELAG